MAQLPIGQSRDGLPRPGQPPDPVADAISDLYRACHLRPPAVLVARDAVHFGRLVGRLVRGLGPVEATAAMLLASALFILLMPPRGDAFGAVYGALLAILLVPLVLAGERARHGVGAALKATVLRIMASVLLGACVLGAAYLAGVERQQALLAAGLTLGAGACAQLALALLAPSIARWRLSRSREAGAMPLSPAVIVWGGGRADAVISSRLQSALQDVERARGLRDLHSHRGLSQLNLETLIRTEAQGLGVWSTSYGVVLGQAVGHSRSLAARIGGLVMAGIDHDALPRILQTAVELDRRADAVATFGGVAVVLPAGAPAIFTPPPRPPRSNRRSGRLPWREALRWLDDPFGPTLAVDLAPVDGLADWFLARAVMRLPDAERRTPAIKAMGVGRVVAALWLRPVHADDHGRLYQMGHPEDPSAFVAVRDRVLDADGDPLEHWIAVPPHMATAREAVAWSFGMSEAAYRPVQEV